MRFVRLSIGGLFLLFIALAVTGCGEPDASGPNKFGTDDNRQETRESRQEASGGHDVLRYLASDPPTLDPHQVSDTISSALAVEVFGGLATLDAGLRVVPDLADHWEVSPDRLKYTFFLRKEAKFHDGKPVTAHDVKFSFERALDPKTLSPTVDTYLDDIVGAADKLAGRASEISGVTVIDRYTLKITIDAPKAYFLAKLTYPTAFVVDQKQIERDGHDWIRNPNGTGPFKLHEYRIGERLVLERNPYYHLGPAKLNRVEMILSGGSAMAMYENGEIDITGVGLPDLDRVTNPTDPLNAELVAAPPSFDIYYVGFNVTEPPFDDINVRQAMSHAIDKELIGSQVLLGLLTPAYGILPEGLPGYTGKIQGLKHDPEKAKRLIASSRYAEQMPRIVITVPGTGGSVGLDLEVIEEMWRQTLGLEVEFSQVEWATFLEDLSNGEFQAFAGLGWAADYPDPQDFLDILFHSRSKLNHTGYSNPQLDKLLEAARVSPSWEERVSLYQKAEQLIVDNAPWIPLWYVGEQLVLIKPYVKGYRLTPLIVPKLREVSIER